MIEKPIRSTNNVTKTIWSVARRFGGAVWEGWVMAGLLQAGTTGTGTDCPGRTDHTPAAGGGAKPALIDNVNELFGFRACGMMATDLK